jgi:hypothetical protein
VWVYRRVYFSPSDHPSHATLVWKDTPSGSNEAAQRANLEEAGHENNMLQEGNNMAIEVWYGKVERQKNGLPTLL